MTTVDGDIDVSNIHLDGIDKIVQTQIDEIQDGAYDKKLLLDIYRNL